LAAFYCWACLLFSREKWRRHFNNHDQEVAEKCVCIEGDQIGAARQTVGALEIWAVIDLKDVYKNKEPD
jgi:hypothetical protein